MKKFLVLLTSLFTMYSIVAQDSLNMRKLSTWTSTSAQRYNDCWGYSDTLGNEYAIVGSNWGTHFIDVTDPENPNEIKSIAGWNSDVIWRDYKVFEQYAYGVADNFGNTLQIFDLSDLPNSVSVVYDDYELSESAHNIYIENDRAYLATNRRNDSIFALDILSLADPENPELIKTLDGSYFGNCDQCIHDIYVKDGIAYCSGGYSGMFIYDLNDLDNPILLSAITTYSASGYNHSSWLHEDGNTLVMADEVPNSLPLKSFDISDYNNPVELATFISDTAGSRPHNPYFNKNDLVVSYYYDGLQIFDFTDPSNPFQSAYYDTYPNNDTLADPFPDSFDGAWGVYPFFESKNIAVVDITYGLFMLTKEKDIYTLQERIDVCDNPTLTQNLDFKVKGEFNSGNIFYLELADNEGSFIISNRIDSLAADSSGNYSFSFDPASYSQINFRFRIRSTDPVMTQSSWLDLKYYSTPNQPTIIDNGGILTCDNTALEYQWFLNGNIIYHAEDISYTPTVSGEYSVRVSNGSCLSDSDPITITILGVKKKNQFINVAMFPNPTKDKVKLFNPSRKQFEVVIYDSKGGEISTFKTSEISTEVTLNKGMYFVKISNSDGFKSIKLIVN